MLNEAKNIIIERNGQQQDINFKEGFLSKLMKQKKAAFILPRVPSIVVQVQDGTGAAKAGMKKGDKITAINGVPTPYYDTPIKIKLIPKTKQPNPISVLNNH